MKLKWIVIKEHYLIELVTNGMSNILQLKTGKLEINKKEKKENFRLLNEVRFLKKKILLELLKVKTQNLLQLYWCAFNSVLSKISSINLAYKWNSHAKAILN